MLFRSHAAGKGNDLAFVEDGLREGEMIEMAAGDIGIIGDENVAIMDILKTVMIDLGFHRLSHAANEHWQAKAD